MSESEAEALDVSAGVKEQVKEHVRRKKSIGQVHDKEVVTFIDKDDELLNIPRGLTGLANSREINRQLLKLHRENGLPKDALLDLMTRQGFNSISAERRLRDLHID